MHARVQHLLSMYPALGVEVFLIPGLDVLDHRLPAKAHRACKCYPWAQQGVGDLGLGALAFRSYSA